MHQEQRGVDRVAGQHHAQRADQRERARGSRRSTVSPPETCALPAASSMLVPVTSVPPRRECSAPALSARVGERADVVVLLGLTQAHRVRRLLHARQQRREQLLLGEDQVPAVVPGEFVLVAHGQRPGRAGLDAQPAEDAAAVVDLVDAGVPLAGGEALLLGVVAALDVDRVGRAGPGAQLAADALLQAVRVTVEDVPAVVPRRRWRARCSGYSSVTTFLNMCAKVTPKPLKAPTVYTSLSVVSSSPSATPDSSPAGRSPSPGRPQRVAAAATAGPPGPSAAPGSRPPAAATSPGRLRRRLLRREQERRARAAASTSTPTMMTATVLRGAVRFDACISRMPASARIQTRLIGISTFQPNRMNWS